MLTSPRLGNQPAANRSVHTHYGGDARHARRRRRGRRAPGPPRTRRWHGAPRRWSRQEVWLHGGANLEYDLLGCVPTHGRADATFGVLAMTGRAPGLAERDEASRLRVVPRCAAGRGHQRQQVDHAHVTGNSPHRVSTSHRPARVPIIARAHVAPARGHSRVLPSKNVGLTRWCH